MNYAFRTHAQDNKHKQSKIFSKIANRIVKVPTPLQRLIGKNDQLILVSLVPDKVDSLLYITNIDPIPERADVHHQVGEMLVLALS